jgi:hypothetical protein
MKKALYFFVVLALSLAALPGPALAAGDDAASSGVSPGVLLAAIAVGWTGSAASDNARTTKKYRAFFMVF